ncbi:S-layer homology domain-containing protein, partial [Vallitalea sediminicola]
HKEITFEDDASLSIGARVAVTEMQTAGILAGKSDNKFDPQGIATRAEVSVMLKRFVEIAISESMAKGFIKNDSGEWMY